MLPQLDQSFSVSPRPRILIYCWFWGLVCGGGGGVEVRWVRSFDLLVSSFLKLKTFCRPLRKPHKCTICDFRDNQRSRLVRHMKSEHNVILPKTSVKAPTVVALRSTDSSPVLDKKRRRSSDENVQRENSWYFDIVPSRYKKGDSTHSSVTRTVFD